MAQRDLPAILEANGINEPVTRVEGCGGGCISSAFVITTASQKIFIKTNSPEFEPNFRAEFAGLEKIAATNTVLCPRPLFVGTLGRTSYIGMSYLPNLQGASAELGAPLARMHLAGRSGKFGFPIRTFCGATPLDNSITDEPWSVWFSRH
jgi:fructosamine-3-kinase